LGIPIPGSDAVSQELKPFSTPSNHLFTGPNSNSPAIGLPSIEFQKLVVSGTFHLRNRFPAIRSRRGFVASVDVRNGT
jgi:hypothetical protein